MRSVSFTSVPLAASRDTIEHCFRCLSPEEISKAGSFATDQLASRFVIAHGALRILLGRCLAVDPRALDFDFGPYGKPRLSAKYGAPLVHFNLSHSRDCALIAIGDLDVGADIEYLSEDIDIPSLAETVMTSLERARLTAVEVPARIDLFYRYWVAKEACVKQTGEGVNRDLRRIEVSFRADACVAASDDKRWYITELPVADQYRACLATAEPAEAHEAILALPGAGGV